MAAQLPDPPVPADVDLRGLEWMPLYGARLFGSDFDAHADDTAFRAGLQLWWAAWNQVPASSLPDDDVALCRLAGLGRDIKTWKRIRSMALHGFVRCSDDRLYHATMAGWALVSWEKRLREREKKAKWRAARERSQGPGQDRRGDRDKPHAEPGQEPGHTPHVPVSGTDDRTGQDRGGQDRKVRKDSAAASSASAREPRPPSQEAALPHAETDRAFELWMPVAYRLRIPDPGFLNTERREALRLRLIECGGIEGWKRALEHLESAQFLRDDDDPAKPKAWVNLANLLKPENFTGLMEGRYAERRERNTQQRGPNLEALAASGREGAG